MIRPLGDSNVAPREPANGKEASGVQGGVAVVTISTLSCRGCSSHLVKGSACELLRAGSASFHCAVKESCLNSSFRVLRHEGGDSRKVDRLTCSSCDRPLGISMKLDGINPRVLLKAKDLLVTDNNNGTVSLEKWSELTEAKAALGDEKALKFLEALTPRDLRERDDETANDDDAVVEPTAKNDDDADEVSPAFVVKEEADLDNKPEDTSENEEEQETTLVAESTVALGQENLAIVEKELVEEPAAVEEQPAEVEEEAVVDPLPEEASSADVKKNVPEEISVEVVEDKPKAPPIADLSLAAPRAESSELNERGPMPITRPWYAIFSGCSLCGIF